MYDFCVTVIGMTIGNLVYKKGKALVRRVRSNNKYYKKGNKYWK